MVTSAKYVKSENKNSDNENTSIKATIGGQKWSVPLDPSNRHYQAIQEWVAEGNTIEDAD